MNLLGKRQVYQGTECKNSGAPKRHIERRIVFFASVLKEVRVDNFLVILKEKGGISMCESEITRKCYANKDCLKS